MKKHSEIFSSLHKIDSDKIEKLVGELSQLEHEADLTKNDIRNHLPKSLFLPIDRAHFLEILSIQDSIADEAEAIGVLLTLRPLEQFDNFHKELLALHEKNQEAFLNAKQVIEEIDELLESSFGGIEAEEKMKRKLMKRLFTEGDSLSTPAFTLWLRLIEDIGAISHISERLANRIRMILELK
jgi:predicted phosphate transport protein (TIGR00153 family)